MCNPEQARSITVLNGMARVLLPSERCYYLPVSIMVVNKFREIEKFRGVPS